MKAAGFGSTEAAQGRCRGGSRFGSVLGQNEGSRDTARNSRSKDGGPRNNAATRKDQSPAGRVSHRHGTPPVNADAQRQLKALLEEVRNVLNGIVELVLPGGGAADFSKPSTHAGQPLRRFIPSNYEDGRSAPAGADAPGAREISNAVSATTGEKGNAANASDLFWLWGQFLDHDIDLVKTGDASLPISIPEGDTTFDPANPLPFHRSDSTTNLLGAEQQINVITALIDGSNIYGSDAETTASLRSGEGGRLSMQDDATLPTDERGFYRAGDERVNENIGLTSMHTLFAREHNRVADTLSAENPDWSDQQIFDAARTQVTATLQSITVNEFLPILLGGDGIGAYDGPVAGLDAQVSNVFAAAAYRFGHSMVSDAITPVDAEGQAGESISLKDAFFNPAKFEETGIDAILRGFASNEAQAMDTEIVDSLRNFVLDGPNGPRLDLAALNIQRGRDHGLPTLNQARQALGLAPITSFDDPAFRDGAGARLASVYDSPDQIDLWVGLLAEKPTGDGLVGPTQSIILRDQFTRLRDGDPNWYANALPADSVAEIEATSLADIIERNTGVDAPSDTAMTLPVFS